MAIASRERRAASASARAGPEASGPAAAGRAPRVARTTSSGEGVSNRKEEGFEAGGFAGNPGGAAEPVLAATAPPTPFSLGVALICFAIADVAFAGCFPLAAAAGAFFPAAAEPFAGAFFASDPVSYCPNPSSQSSSSS